MDKTDVVWLSYHKPEILARGYWDQGLLENIFNLGNYQHHDSVDTVKDGAIVIINGRTHTLPEDIAKLNADIAKLRWVLFIDTGDEEAIFPWRDVKHPVMRVWVMLPRMNQHDDTAFKLPNGYRPGTPQILKELGPQERNLDWFFSGQVNHERRQQCFDVLKQFEAIYPNTVTLGGDTFGKEILPQRDYLHAMARAKIALCPSGIESPDNFRLYEALEAGCIPVVDAFSTRNKSSGFWRYVFGDNVPFPIIDYWDAFPKLLPELLKGWPANANKCFAWWQQKKREIKYKLRDDVKELSK